MTLLPEMISSINANLVNCPTVLKKIKLTHGGSSLDRNGKGQEQPILVKKSKWWTSITRSKTYDKANVTQVSWYWCRYRQTIRSIKLMVQEAAQMHRVTWFMVKVALNCSGYESILSVMWWVHCISTQKNINLISYLHQHNFIWSANLYVKGKIIHHQNKTNKTTF